MREEYKAIIDAGLTVQLDDPSLAESWDQINPEPSLADYLKFIQLRVEATGLARELRGQGNVIACTGCGRRPGSVHPHRIVGLPGWHSSAEGARRDADPRCP